MAVGAKRESAGAADPGREAKRHRPKKSVSGIPVRGIEAGAGARHGSKSTLNALDPTVITPKIWQELVRARGTRRLLGASI